MATADLDSDGVHATFKGNRYALVPNYSFQISPQLKSVSRTINLSCGDERGYVEAIATFEGSKRRITMMGTPYRDAEILLFFTTLDNYARDAWRVTTEQQRRWPCSLAYEADSQTDILTKWRLVVDVPAPEVMRIAEIAATKGTSDMRLEMYLGGLYAPEAEWRSDGCPSGDLAYLLPTDHWGEKTPKAFGYVSWLEVEQQLFRRK